MRWRHEPSSTKTTLVKLFSFLYIPVQRFNNTELDGPSVEGITMPNGPISQVCESLTSGNWSWQVFVWQSRDAMKIS